MAMNLLRAGYQVHVTVHRSIDNVNRLLAIGATLCESKSSAVLSSDIIVLCLPNSTEVVRVIDEVRTNLRSGHLVLDTGTSSVVETNDLAQQLQSLGVMFVEAPVAGGITQAEMGELGAFVGGSKEAFYRIRPVLDQFCTSIQHFGPVGSGGKAKLISNYLVLGMIRLILETFHAADIVGVDWGPSSIEQFLTVRVILLLFSGCSEASLRTTTIPGTSLVCRTHEKIWNTLLNLVNTKDFKQL